MKLTARVALLVLAFISLTGIIGGGIFVHQHSGQGSGGQTLTGTTINNPIITGATLTGTINNPTITGTITGTPIWASTQTLPALITSTIQLPNDNLAPSSVGGIYQGSNAIQLRGGTSGFTVNNNANSLVNFSVSDAGTSTARTSVVTPLVTTSGAVGLGLGINGASNWSINTGFALLPGSDNTQQIGSGTNRVLALFTPIIDSGTTGSVSIRTNNGSNVASFANDFSVALFGTLSSTKACATNYTRIGPNFCRATVFATDAWADATACTGRTFTKTLPVDAKALVLNIEWAALANNAVAARLNTIAFFSDTSCTNQVWFSSHRSQEFVATVAGTILTIAHEVVIVPPSTTNQINTTQTNAGGNGNADVQSVYLMGYFD